MRAQYHLHSSVSRPSMKLMETVLGATATDTVLHSSRSVFSIICSRRVVLGDNLCSVINSYQL